LELKDTLKQIREKNGLTKRELCEKTGISERAYLTYEFGEREPKISVIQKLADFYGVTTDYLLGRNSQKSNELTPTQREEIATQKWLSLDKEKRDALLQMMETCIKTFEAAEADNKE
jgi:transcriptional regulator with XRE-family HTH domain